MSSKPVADSPAAKPSALSKLAIPILILIVCFFGYGFYERTRLIAMQKQEQEAIKSIMAIKGNTMNSDTKDWRVVFVPDQPDTAVRVGTIYFPHEGEGPEYTQKLVDLLNTCDMCEVLFISDGPFVRKGGGGMFGGPPPKKEEEVKPKQDLQLLDVAVIRQKFPKLQIHGEEVLAKARKPKSEGAESVKATDAAAEKTTVEAAKKEPEQPVEQPKEAVKEEPAKTEPSKEEPAATPEKKDP
jgi:hypothetical protein